MDRLSLPAFLAQPGWLPIRAWCADDAWRFDWAWFDRKPLDAPFFRDSVEDALRLPFNQALRPSCTPEALAAGDWPAVPLTALVYHASRCGSTLIAQMLASQPSHAVYAEAMPVDQLLRARYRDPRWSEAEQVTALRQLARAYGRPRRGSERAMVFKLDAWSVAEAGLLRAAFPGVPALFVYRDPVEIVVSHLHQPGVHTVPGVNGPSPLWDDLPVTLPRAEYIARVIGRILAAGLAECRAGTMRPLAYPALPQAIWGEFAPVFELGAAARDALAIAGQRNAKRPDETFRADSADKQAAADPALLELVERWAGEPYRALEALRGGADGGNRQVAGLP